MPGSTGFSGSGGTTTGGTTTGGTGMGVTVTVALDVLLCGSGTGSSVSDDTSAVFTYSTLSGCPAIDTVMSSGGASSSGARLLGDGSNGSRAQNTVCSNDPQAQPGPLDSNDMPTGSSSTTMIGPSASDGP